MPNYQQPADMFLGLKRIAEQNDLAQQMQQKSMYDAAMRRQQQQMAMQLNEQQSWNRQLESQADMDRRAKPRPPFGGNA